MNVIQNVFGAVVVYEKARVMLKRHHFLNLNLIRSFKMSRSAKRVSDLHAKVLQNKAPKLYNTHTHTNTSKKTLDAKISLVYSRERENGRKRGEKKI